MTGSRVVLEDGNISLVVANVQVSWTCLTKGHRLGLYSPQVRAHKVRAPSCLTREVKKKKKGPSGLGDEQSCANQGKLRHRKKAIERCSAGRVNRPGRERRGEEGSEKREGEEGRCRNFLEEVQRKCRSDNKV